MEWKLDSKIRLGLFIALKQQSIEVEAIELGDWARDEGELLKRLL